LVDASGKTYLNTQRASLACEINPTPNQSFRRAVVRALK
jgi:hypothetical protein